MTSPQALTIAGKQEREERLDELKASVLDRLEEPFEGREKELGAAFRALTKKLVRQRVVCADQVRIDGRGLVDHPHVERGGGRGAARARLVTLRAWRDADILGVTTLNMLSLEQKLDTLSLAGEDSGATCNNYNFPPYSTGETGPRRVTEAS